MSSEPQNLAPHDLNTWVTFLSSAEIPVLKHTAREMERLKLDEDNLTARAIASVVNHDPMMAFRVLRHMQTHKNKHQLQDLVLVEQAIMMMGMNPFFRDLPTQLVVQDTLKHNLPALTHLLRLIHRSNRAAHYAFEWGVLLRDLRLEETRIAALLHDLVEILMWCFAPDNMMKIFELQQADKTLRSAKVQENVFGFRLAELQLLLIDSCNLPPLLSKLMDDTSSKDQQVKSVSLAANLARHSANGWQDAALPDDYAELALLLRVDLAKAKQIAITEPDK
ncbi:MAG: HDOD domain-containing protein [Methylophilaceae bacterium]|nr:HDOD domain-containing protein [Methyloradius sp.]